MVADMQPLHLFGYAGLEIAARVRELPNWLNFLSNQILYLSQHELINLLIHTKIVREAL